MTQRSAPEEQPATTHHHSQLSPQLWSALRRRWLWLTALLALPLLLLLFGSIPGSNNFANSTQQLLARISTPTPTQPVSVAAAFEQHHLDSPFNPPVDDQYASPTISASDPAVRINTTTARPTSTARRRPTTTSTTTMTPTPTALNLGLPPRDQWTDVRGRPSLSADRIDAILASYGSPAVGTGIIWVEFSHRYGIDNAVALAFFIHESSAGTDPNWSGNKRDGTSTYNVGNIECAGYTRCYGRWRDYDSWEEGIEDWYRLIAVTYVQKWGLTTVEEILPVYAPEFENDVALYVAMTQRRIGQFRNIPTELWPPIPTPRPTTTPTPSSTPSATPTEMPPVAGAQRMPNLVGLDLEEALFLLQEVGIVVDIVDMQLREHIPDLFDQVPERTIISTQPQADAWVLPDDEVILGVRAPDQWPPPTPTPGTNPAPDETLSAPLPPPTDSIETEPELRPGRGIPSPEPEPQPEPDSLDLEPTPTLLATEAEAEQLPPGE